MSSDDLDGRAKRGGDQYRSPDSAPVFDPEEALRRCFDNPQMVQEMVRSLFDEADRLLEEIRQAEAARDAPALARAAHRLKGTVVYLGAKPTAEATRRVEQIGASGDLAPAPEAIDALEAELMRLMDALLDHQRRHS